MISLKRTTSDTFFRKRFFSYRLFVWMLLLMALIMGGGYLIIAFVYNLQKDTEQRIDAAQRKVVVARQMEIELVRLRGFTLTYLVDKEQQWLDSIRVHELQFIVYMERARQNATSPEEVQLIQQISALFSNYEQRIHNAASLARSRNYRQADALLIHAGKDLLETIHEKSREFIQLNRQAELSYENAIQETNALILKIMLILGLGGILAGLLLGWIISRMVFRPINQLILQVRGAQGGTVLEKLEIAGYGDLEELGDRIRSLMARINQAQKDLEKNKMLLQYSNKYAVLGKVAPTVAHEIRNPLAAIKMLVYSMKDVPGFPDSLQQDLEIITREINRMEDFIKNFLKFARPPDPVFTELNPVEVLRDVINLLRPRFKSNNILLSEQFNENSHGVMADAGHLKQLFMNLLINAVEAMPQGGHLRLIAEPWQQDQTGETAPSQSYLRITIDDEGPGIPGQVLQNLFEPFMKGNEHGVGLGLSISQNIAGMHHGWIEAYNKPGNTGAVFQVFLPLIKTT
jgi:two-component system, NtrC family, sensor histidine kinase HydH